MSHKSRNKFDIVSLREPFVSGLPDGDRVARAPVAPELTEQLRVLARWAREEGEAVRPYAVDRYDGSERIEADAGCAQALRQYELIVKLAEALLAWPRGLRAIDEGMQARDR